MTTKIIFFLCYSYYYCKRGAQPQAGLTLGVGKKSIAPYWIMDLIIAKHIKTSDQKGVE
jgi:hypothetical protein